MLRRSEPGFGVQTVCRVMAGPASRPPGASCHAGETTRQANARAPDTEPRGRAGVAAPDSRPRSPNHRTRAKARTTSLGSGPRLRQTAVAGDATAVTPANAAGTSTGYGLADFQAATGNGTRAVGLSRSIFGLGLMPDGRGLTVTAGRTCCSSRPRGECVWVRCSTRRCPRLPMFGAGTVASAGAEPSYVIVNRTSGDEAAASDVQGLEFAGAHEFVDFRAGHRER